MIHGVDCCGMLTALGVIAAVVGLFLFFGRKFDIPLFPKEYLMNTSLDLGLNNLPPNTLPIEEGVYLLGYLRKQPFDRRKTIWSAYRVADFAAEQVLPGTPEAQLVGTHVELRAMLESQLQGFETIQQRGDGQMGAVGFNWRTLLQLLIKFLPEIIGGFSGA